jgi:hypothetical protein
LASIDDAFINNMLGSCFSYAFLPVVGTRGGILVVWRSDVWSASHPSCSKYAVLVKMCHIASKVPWRLMVVYGPQGVVPRTPSSRSFAALGSVALPMAHGR